jgi:YHS domain-containing protein
MTTDPVCGAEIEEASSAAEADYGDNRYYFCSESCKEEFERAPARYVDRGEQPTAWA